MGQPLKDFHKDEVRAIGHDLGLPQDFVQRHPFPGMKHLIGRFLGHFYIKRNFLRDTIGQS